MKRSDFRCGRFACAILSTLMLTLAADGQDSIRQVTFPGMDGLSITADLYDSGDRAAPTIVLFHQSLSSRGEYRQIAPRIAAAGRNVLAVDLRWGATDRWNDIENQTAERFGTEKVVEAAKAGDRSEVWPTIFLAYDDMLSAMDWLSGEEFTGPRVVVGSSFSAMLALRIPGERDVDAVVAFSPGEYYEADSLLARRWAAQIEVPTLIVGGPDECDTVSPIRDSLRSPVRSLLVTDEGRHGASILNDSDEAWRIFETFLSAFDKPDEVTFPTVDGVTIFGDWYERSTEASDSKIALLLHQGGSNSRAEYATTIPTLRMLGYNVLALDLRRGGSRFGGTNRTVESLSIETPGYCDAFADLEAGLTFLNGAGHDGPFVVFGSSFSAALAIQLAATRPEAIAAVLAFSPASGDPMAGCQPEQFISQLKGPGLILRPAPELHYGTVNAQLQLFREAGLQTYVARNGVHGSSMLNPRRVLGTVNENWEAVLAFLAEAVE